LYDWFWGSDEQWLYDIDADRTIYSHDHGLYLPPGNGAWTESELTQEVHTPRPLPNNPADGVSEDALRHVAEKLRALESADIVDVLIQVPQSWAVSDHDLEALGWFLETRAPDVADRLEALV
jgi:hypothetical protein